MSPRPRSAPTWLPWHSFAMVMAVIVARGPRLRAEPPASAPTTAESGDDAAAKELLAANGLFRRGLFKLAEQQYAAFLADHPQHARRTDALYALAVCQYRQGDYDKAVPLLNAALRDAAFSRSDEALAVLGHCEWSRRQYDPALAAYDRLLAQHANSPYAPTAVLARAQVLYAAGRWKECADAASKCLARDDAKAQHADALYVLALARRAINDDKGAVEALSKLVAQDEKSPLVVDALVQWAEILQARGSAQEAAEHLKQALAAAPADRMDDVRARYGSALLAAGQYDSAIAELAVVAEKTSEVGRFARLHLGFAQLAAGHPDVSRRTLASLAGGDDPLATQAAHGLARCDLAQGRHREALAALDALLAGKPSMAVAIQMDRAACLTGLERFADAAAQYESIAASSPQSVDAAEATYRRAYCLRRLGRYDECHALCHALPTAASAALIQAAAELDAEALLAGGRYADAAKQYRELAAKADAGRRDAFKLREAQCVYASRDYAHAAELLTPLTSVNDPAMAEAKFLLGDALLQLGKNAEAAAVLQKYQPPAGAESAEARYKLAIAQERAGNVTTAEQTLAGLAEAPDASPWVQRGLLEYGQLCQKARRIDEATRALNRVVQHGAEECAAPALDLLAWIDFDAKRFAEAAAKWQQLTRAYPKQPVADRADFNRGVALKEAKKWSAAAEALRRFATEHSESPDAFEALRLEAQCLADGDQPEAAAKALGELTRSPPPKGAAERHEQALYDLAWVQRSLKRAADAEQTYSRLLAEHADGKLAMAARAEMAELLYADGKYAEAAGALEKLPKPAAPAQYRVAWCYQKLNQLGKAAAAFEAVAADEHAEPPVAASAGLQAGLAYAQLSQWERAERVLAAAARKYADEPTAPATLLKLGEVQAERSEFSASEQTYRTFLMKTPKESRAFRAHFGLGWALENQKRYDEARQEYRLVTEGHDGDTAARAQFQIGETLLAQEKFDEAIPALLAVEDVYGDATWAPRALLEAGRAFEHTKQPDHARKQYEQIVKKYKDAPECAAARERLQAMKA